MAPFLSIATSKFDFAQQIPGHPINFVELALVSAERARVRVLQEPSVLALHTYRFLTNFALQWTFKDHIAHSTY